MRCKYKLGMDLNEFLKKFYLNYGALFDMEDEAPNAYDKYVREHEPMMEEFDELFDNRRFLEFLREFEKLRKDNIDTTKEQIAFMTTLKEAQKGARK